MSGAPRTLARLLACACLAACGAARSGTGTGAGAAAASARDAETQIRAASHDFSQRYMRGDAAGMAAAYTEDGMIMPPGRPIIRGRAAIESYWRLAPNVVVTEHRATPDSIVVRGDVAYDYGSYFAQVTQNGTAANPTHGKYVIVWRRESDGAWRMHVDIWNGSPPPGR